MALNYDFDIFDIMPAEIFADKEIASLVEGVGIKQNSVGNKIALFRDKKTVDAINAAPPTIKEYLGASGFGFNVYDSGAPAGRYPAKDDGMRAHIMQKLNENLDQFGLSNLLETNGRPDSFRYMDFMAAVIGAEPIDMASVQRTQRKSASATKKPFYVRPIFLVVVLVVFMVLDVLRGLLLG